MDKYIKKYLFDISDSIKAIKEFVPESFSFEMYENNKMVRRAVEREFEIIGEAISNILKIDKTINISNSRKIVAFRN